ncbi:MAG: hypothetical protein CYG59_09715 [Chloroflexi bacterium]|nr:MAG: hypothetical protein CYG59_09715 [Chloroflexota bacterium]
MYQTEADFREERRRRLLYGFFGVSMFLTVVICAVLLFLVLAPPQGQRRLGSVSQFAVGEVVAVPVKRLELTKVLPKAPNWSEDIIYVVKQPNEGYQAFLSLDPVTGCKLNWNNELQRFVDGCSQTRYMLSGRNATDATTLVSTPQHMIEMPVEVQGSDVYVMDRMLRRDRQQ